MAFTPSLTTARPARRPARSFSGSSSIREVAGRSADFRSGAFPLESQHPPGRRPALRGQCLKMRPARAQLDTPTTDGRANLPVCPNLTASQRSNAGGTLGIRTPEHRSARSGESLGGAAAPPYLGGVKLRPPGAPVRNPALLSPPFCIYFPIDSNAKFASMSKEFIRIGGAREHNLKNLTLNIPRDKLVVITGLSGGGKSSLAFDTIYAEGQRKYVESLSAYARQFLDQMQKPEVDFIEGLSPAIAIEQRSSGSSPRSIIATTTEIYDYLRLLYAHVGKPHCPDTGVPIVSQTTSDIVDKILALPPKTRVMLLAPVVRRQKGEFRDVIERLAREGFVRARVDGELVELEANTRIKLDKKKFHTIEAVVDRLVIDDKIRVRLGDSVETALRWGVVVLLALHNSSGRADLPVSQGDQQVAPTKSTWTVTLHANKMCSPATGKSYDPPTPKHFSFNAPAGACPVCHGLGQKMIFDESLVVPDPEKSLEDGAVQPWRRAGKRMNIYYKAMLRSVVAHFNVSLETPWKNLPDDFKKVLLHGSGESEVAFHFWRAGSQHDFFEIVRQVFPGRFQ